MFTARRFLRVAPLALLLTAASLLTACSSDVTGPSASRRSGYITTSATIQGASASTAADSTAKTGTTGTTGSTGTSSSTGTSTKKSSTNSSGTKTLSGYNVPAL